jgi:hypothetical protein
VGGLGAAVRGADGLEARAVEAEELGACKSK